VLPRGRERAPLFWGAIQDKSFQKNKSRCYKGQNWEITGSGRVERFAGIDENKIAEKNRQGDLKVLKKAAFRAMGKNIGQKEIKNDQERQSHPTPT